MFRKRRSELYGPFVTNIVKLRKIWIHKDFLFFRLITRHNMIKKRRTISVIFRLHPHQWDKKSECLFISLDSIIKFYKRIAHGQSRSPSFTKNRRNIFFSNWMCNTTQFSFVEDQIIWLKKKRLSKGSI